MPYLYGNAILHLFLGETGVSYPDDNSDLIDEIISSIADTSASSNAPEYVQNASTLNGSHQMFQTDNYVNGQAFFGPGCINGNEAVSVYGYGNTYGNDNPVFMDDGYSLASSNHSGFDIDYLQFPEQVLKVQVGSQQQFFILFLSWSKPKNSWAHIGTAHIISDFITNGHINILTTHNKFSYHDLFPFHMFYENTCKTFSTCHKNTCLP